MDDGRRSCYLAKSPWGLRRQNHRLMRGTWEGVQQAASRQDQSCVRVVAGACWYPLACVQPRGKELGSRTRHRCCCCCL